MIQSDDSVKKEPIDMSKVHSKEQVSGSSVFIMLGFFVVIFIVLAILYCYTLSLNKDPQSSSILDIMKIFIGLVVGSLVTKFAEKHE